MKSLEKRAYAMIPAISSAAIPVNRFIAALGSEPSVRPGGRAGAGGDAQRVDPSQQGVPVGKSELTEEERQQVADLKRRDNEVRRHEAAHQSTAGALSQGGPSFETQRGPDGREYAVGGEVGIDSAPVEGDPAGTIRKMQQVRRAALAPANPSSQDRQVAAQAAQAEQQARAELNRPTDEASEPGGFGTTQGEANAFRSALAAQFSNTPGRFINVAV